MAYRVLLPIRDQNRLNKSGNICLKKVKRKITMKKNLLNKDKCLSEHQVTQPSVFNVNDIIHTVLVKLHKDVPSMFLKKKHYHDVLVCAHKHNKLGG